MSLTHGTEILTKLVKNLSPEELAAKIASFDQGVCTQLFLSELKPILPTPEQVRIPFYVIRRV